MNKNDLAIPSIHMNGTSVAGLYQPIADAYSKVKEAQEALAQTMPHQRDYYIQIAGDENYRKARHQHEARIQKLQNVLDELLEIGIRVQHGGFQGDMKS